MANLRVILCGGADLPEEWASLDCRKNHLAISGRERNIDLKITDINKKLWMDIPDYLVDLLEIATYVYCADQAISRGGSGVSKAGEDWKRHFKLVIPVRDQERWTDPRIGESLERMLGFLSGDIFEFQFAGIKDPPGIQTYLDIQEGPAGGFPAEEVNLFSGGLDSLSGAIQELFVNKRNVVLVSHRSSDKVYSIQKGLADHLARISKSVSKCLHIPVRVHKHGLRAYEETQRTRSFLYACFASVVAKVFGLSRINFYENGVTSLNLPISEQIVGTKATRSTHPQVLQGFSGFFEELFGGKLEVRNPFLWMTKSEIVNVIAGNGLADMISHTFSCSYPRSLTRQQTHCGGCYQCIDRRFAILSSGCEEDDSGDMYGTDLLIGERNRSESKTMAESYVKFANEMEDLNEFSFLQRFPEIHRAIDGMDCSRDEAFKKFYTLLKRHSEQIGKVVDEGIARYKTEIRKGTLPETCLIRMVASTKKKRIIEHRYRFSTPDGAIWKDIEVFFVSKDSVEVICRDVRKTYLFSDIGFRENRKGGDIADDNWEVLRIMAENGGSISWESSTLDPKIIGGLTKRMETIRERLRYLFGIETDPFKYLRSEKRWTAKFTIEDHSYGKIPSAKFR
jgi:7-cyano-7-deazaguanine synthase in queuosine biosynthesis